MPLFKQKLLWLLFGQLLWKILGYPTFEHLNELGKLEEDPYLMKDKENFHFGASQNLEILFTFG